MKNISKSRFISGVQCHKKVWFDYHRNDLKPPVDEKTQQIFDLGHRIGALAWQRFPNGKDATPIDYSDFNPSIENTKIWIAEKVENIYEATFQAENVLSMLDILHREGNDLWAIEVKNSTSVKDYHLWDAALQNWVMTEAGYQPQKFFLMHIDNQYVKNGEITPDIFNLEDITMKVIELQNWVTQNIAEILQVVNNDKEPQINIGSHCSKPFGCDYQHHCWAHIPKENSVFTLSRVGNKAWDFYDQGILKIEEIPEDYPLTQFQDLQYRGIKFGDKNIDVESIRNFIDEWQFPLYFFDFETIFPAIPVLDTTRPYQQVPFQYSLHVLEQNNHLSHFEFLADPVSFQSKGEKALKELVESLKSHFGERGSIVSYNMTFEKNVLTNLAERFPEDRLFLEHLIDRMVDLMVVFQKNWYYDPQMGKSYSIKAVLPALLPELSYKDLVISNGDMASQTFQMSVEKGQFLDENLQQNLLEYCKLDTYAMVVLYKFLKELI